ncbi:MAG: CoA pyrophosphatase [Hyphomicrobiales bacterium]|nr:MAG: CoA pyrophosphatase [Hyphomicrobiales bacterium]
MAKAVADPVTDSLTDDAFLADFMGRLAKAYVPGTPPRESGDHVLDLNRPKPPTELKSAAVLIAIIVHDNAPSVVLTRRTAHLSSHAGQIAFPGGRSDLVDATRHLTALREAEEEIGLDPTQVHIVGMMNPYMTGSGYNISPIIGLVKPPVSFAANPDEVSEIFEVPLSFLMQPGNYQKIKRNWNGVTHHTYAIPYQDHYIWGVTAGILRTLYENLYLL